MGKDLHNDNFEDFFKKHLESFDDEPADDMWERIEPVIPPKPGIVWSAYAMPSALILSLALLVFVGVKMFEYKKTSEDLTEQLEQSNRDIQSAEEQTIILKDDKVELDKNSTIDANQQENNTSENQISIIENSNSPTRTIENRVSKTKESTSNNITKNTSNKSKKTTEITTKTNYEQTINASPKVEKTTVPTIPEIGKEFIKTNKETSSNTKPVATNNTENWNLLATKNLLLVVDNDWSINKSVTINKPEPLAENELTNRNSIALFATPTILKNNVRPPRPPNGNNPPPNPPNNPRPIPTERVKIGQAIGVKYGYNLTDKLALNIGGMYANTSYDFNTRHFLPYNKDTEQDISTDKAANTIDYSGSSTYGEYSVDADVTRLKDNGVTQDEEIDIKVDATAKIHSIIVPAYLTYELFEVNGFSVGLKGGVSYNNVISNDLKINSFEVQKPGFEVQDFRLKKRPKPSKKGAINSLSGVVLAYNFQDKWSFVVEPTWSSALSDNHKADFGRTKSNMFNVDIGLRYSF